MCDWNTITEQLSIFKSSVSTFCPHRQELYHDTLQPQNTADYLAVMYRDFQTCKFNVEEDEKTSLAVQAVNDTAFH